MIQYDDDGRYKGHVSMAEYRQIRARTGDLLDLLRDGMSVVRALRMLALPHAGDVLDLVEWMLADE